MPSVTCLRLSDISVICHVTYFQFPIYVFLPCRSARPHSSVLGLPNIGHRTLPKIWRGFLYGAYSTYFELIRTEKWKQYRDHLVLNFGRSVIIAYSWRSEVARRWNFVRNFCVVFLKTTSCGKIFKILFRKFLSRHRSTLLFSNFVKFGRQKSVKSCVIHLTKKFRLPFKLSLLRWSSPKSAMASLQQCTQSAPCFVIIGSLSAGL